MEEEEKNDPIDEPPVPVSTPDQSAKDPKRNFVKEKQGIFLTMGIISVLSLILILGYKAFKQSTAPTRIPITSQMPSVRLPQIPKAQKKQEKKKKTPVILMENAKTLCESEPHYFLPSNDAKKFLKNLMISSTLPPGVTAIPQEVPQIKSTKIQTSVDKKLAIQGILNLPKVKNLAISGKTVYVPFTENNTLYAWVIKYAGKIDNKEAYHLQLLKQSDFTNSPRNMLMQILPPQSP
jgi:hypothetical protein